MKNRFSWIPFYSEQAKTLLTYKNDRKPLVDFIYSELSQVADRYHRRRNFSTIREST